MNMINITSEYISINSLYELEELVCEQSMCKENIEEYRKCLEIE